jgi:AraC family transcriptional regulator
MILVLLSQTNKYRFDIACEIHTEVRENLQGVIHDVIPAGQCAKIRYQGSDDNLAPAIDYLYTHWLKKSGKALRDFPLFLARVSLYPDVSEAETITDIYLPIK